MMGGMGRSTMNMCNPSMAPHRASQQSQFGAGEMAAAGDAGGGIGDEMLVVSLDDPTLGMAAPAPQLQQPRASAALQEAAAEGKEEAASPSNAEDDEAGESESESGGKKK